MSRWSGVDFEVRRIRTRGRARDILTTIRSLWNVEGYSVWRDVITGRWRLSTWGEDSHGGDISAEFPDFFEEIKNAGGEDVRAKITVRHLEQCATDSYDYPEDEEDEDSEEADEEGTGNRESGDKVQSPERQDEAVASTGGEQDREG